jgi:glucan phosphoethanolaminetransferase (alkaline phosphatase superfamily)
MLKKLIPHLLVAAGFFILTLAEQYIFYYAKGLQIIWLDAGKYLAFYLFFVIATFIKPNGLRLFFLSALFILGAFQLGHVSYFGTQVLPTELWLIFTQPGEINGVLLEELQHVLIPLGFLIVTSALAYLLYKKRPLNYGSKWVGIIFIIYAVYNPVRTYVTHNTWGRQPSTRELAGMNVYLSVSYFLGRILPFKLNKETGPESRNTSVHLAFTKGKPSEWQNIVFILGESLSPHHMSLFGYERPTTPFLDTLKDNPNFLYLEGLSGGVSTDISVAFFMNVGFGEAGAMKAAKGQHCLFKLAKDEGFETHFLSVQSAEQLRYIAPYLCAKSLDDYQALEDVSPETKDLMAADDRVLFPHFEKILASSGKKKFIMLHQRGSHGPWAARSKPEDRKFPHDSKINHYDNSVVEFDLFMQKLYGVLEKTPGKTLVIYVSDHGEALGQNNRWGHGQLIRPAWEIPVLMMSFHAKLPESAKKLPKNTPHYNIALFLAEQMGLRPNMSPFTIPTDYVIYGNDIDGFAGSVSIQMKNDGTYTATQLK